MTTMLCRAALAAVLAVAATAPLAAQTGERAETMAVSVQNRTKPSFCAEDDNVHVTFSSAKVKHFRIEARHPAAIGTIVEDNRAPDFTDCTIQDKPPGPEDKVERIVLFEDDTMMLVGHRHSEFWRKGNVPLVIDEKEEKDLHLVQLFAKTPKGPYEYLVLYPLDGYWRARPLPPARLDEVAYGTSFLVGEVQEKERPFVALKSVRFIPKSKTFELTFPKGDMGSLRVVDITDKVAALEIAFEKPVSRRPFAALRSMYVTDGNADASHVGWRDPWRKGWTTRPLPDFRSAFASEFWLGRVVVSRHNTSAPDMTVKQFAPE